MADQELDGVLIPYGGSVDRPRPIFDESVPYRWNSRITITELVLPGMGKRFEVRLTRMGGPKLGGTPDPVGVRVAQVDDVIAEKDGARAREIALRAHDMLLEGDVVPDLMELQRMVRGASASAGDL